MSKAPSTDQRAPAGAPVEIPRTMDLPRIERAVREILHAIGEDPERDGLLDTPARVARAYQEICGGLLERPEKHLEQTFACEGKAAVTVKDIPFFSLCEHHLLPFFGKVAITYQPSAGKVFGLSKLARRVDGYARRPQVQERLSAQVADAVMGSGLASSVTVEPRFSSSSFLSSFTSLLYNNKEFPRRISLVQKKFRRRRLFRLFRLLKSRKLFLPKKEESVS